MQFLLGLAFGNSGSEPGRLSSSSSYSSKDRRLGYCFSSCVRQLCEIEVSVNLIKEKSLDLSDRDIYKHVKENMARYIHPPLSKLAALDGIKAERERGIVGKLKSSSFWSDALASHKTRWSEIKQDLNKVWKEMQSQKCENDLKGEYSFDTRQHIKDEEVSYLWNYLMLNMKTLVNNMNRAPQGAGPSGGRGLARTGGAQKKSFKTKRLIRNPKTGRWVQRDGKIGQLVLAARRRRRAKKKE
jgi:hypothetical protein